MTDLPVRSTECLRCGRPLKSAKSRAVGMGPTCAKKGDVLDPFAVANSKGQPLFLEDAAMLGDPDTDFNLYGLVCERGPKGEARTNIPHAWKLHSPTGFEWGYGGSGPADLALNTLLRMGCDREEAEWWHQAFKSAFIAPIPQEGGRVPLEEMQSWLQAKREKPIVRSEGNE